MDRFCTNCGNPLEENDVFCKGCGASVEDKKSASISPFKLSKKKLIPVLGALVVIFLAIVVINSLGKEDSETFQLIVGDESYLYYNDSLIELDDDIREIDYNQSFIYKNTAFLHAYGSIVLVDLKRHEYEVIEDVYSYSVSKEDGRFACLDRDELVWWDLSKIDKENSVVDEIESFTANKSLTRFYALNEDGELSSYDAKGKLVKEDILDGDAIYSDFYVVDDQFLIYEEEDVYVYDLKSEKEVETFKNASLYNVYISMNRSNYIIETYDQVIVMTQDEMEEIDKEFFYFIPLESYELAIINTLSEDGAIFNLEGLKGKIEYEETELNTLSLIEDGFLSFVYEDDEVFMYTFKKGRATPEITELKTEEDIEYLQAFDKDHFLYSDGEALYYYNGKTEHELDVDADALMSAHFNQEGGLYIVTDEEVHYVDNKGKSTLVFDEEDIYSTRFNDDSGELLLLDEDEVLHLIKEKKVKQIAEDAWEINFVNGSFFYTLDDGDALYVYEKGKSKRVGEDQGQEEVLRVINTY